MITQKKREALRNIDLLNIAGHFLFILSVVGLIASLVTPDIGFAKSLGFSVAVAGVWCGGCRFALATFHNPCFPRVDDFSGWLVSYASLIKG